jgi:midasin
VPGLDDNDPNDLMRPDDDAPAAPQAIAAAPAEDVAAHAATSAARQLLDGPILADVVHLHAAVCASLAQQSHLPPSSAANNPSAAVEGDIEPQERRAVFVRTYQLGARLLAAAPALSGQLGGDVVDSSLDDATLPGHLYRCVHK